MRFKELETERLYLRKFKTTDASLITSYLQDGVIADTTKQIPYPYTEEDALYWIQSHEESREEGSSFNWCLEEKSSGLLLGAIGTSFSVAHNHAETGYWLAQKFWNRGYITEALKEVIRFSFEDLGLHRVFAHHLTRNPASGRVMQKAGMSHEGTLKDHYKKAGQYENIEFFGITKEKF